ncbi:hypothetical protein AMQ83_13180, partial [Paenibacillus riograndensis]
MMKQPTNLYKELVPMLNLHENKQQCLIGPSIFVTYTEAESLDFLLNRKVNINFRALYVFSSKSFSITFKVITVI